MEYIDNSDYVKRLLKNPKIGYVNSKILTAFLTTAFRGYF